MEKIRIIGVPEHFNYPWIKVVESQPFISEGIKLEWENEPKGSGAMNKAIREDHADIAIVLTESFVKDKIEGNPARIIGFHVQSPLIWGIHIPGKSRLKELKELKNVPFLISRFGSGSHLMAFLLAEREGWNLNDLQFEVIGDLDGAKKAFENGAPKVFLWEKYTTKPLVDTGSFIRIGEIPTPWPCFAIVARPDVLEKHPAIISKLRDSVYGQSKKIQTKQEFAAILSKTYGISEVDISEWLAQTSWTKDATVKTGDLEATMDILKNLGLIEKKIPVSALVDKNLVNLS